MYRRRHGQPALLLRLSVSCYRLLQVIRAGEAVSEATQALRGIFVGSGGATTDVRLFVADVRPAIDPTVFAAVMSAS